MPERYLAKHIKWKGEFVLNDDGTFTGGKGKKGNGTWEKRDDGLVLRWYHWGNQVLEKTNNGYKSEKLRLIHKKKFVSISFCTTCMGRLCYLEETLPYNLEVASKYKNIEFVLLDYNSQDGLEDWIRGNMMTHIESGRLVYFKNSEPTEFDMSHAKNMSHRLATRDVLCNLDADNTISDEFVQQLRYEFANDINVVLKPNSNLKGNAGRISLSNENFHKIRGYDESAVGWGNEDQDFFNKCDILGLKPIKVEDAYSIPHSDHERGANYEINKIRMTSRLNAETLSSRLEDGYFLSNMYDSYGDGRVVKNFTEDIELKEVKCETEKAKLKYTFNFTARDGRTLLIRLYDEPNMFLKQMKGNRINGIASYWFEKGGWKEEGNTITLIWKNRELEIFHKQDDGSFASLTNKMVRIDD